MISVVKPYSLHKSFLCYKCLPINADIVNSLPISRGRYLLETEEKNWTKRYFSHGSSFSLETTILRGKIYLKLERKTRQRNSLVMVDPSVWRPFDTKMLGCKKLYILLKGRLTNSTYE